ncbi:phage neck terminator protein [Filifactor alocis]|uniref:phage neck terminator protein n=1 Tax=Filifactor alocis TaxID=143361 RepID=UPI003C6FB376
MITEDIRNKIIEKMTDMLGFPVIQSNQTEDRPPYPFLTYTIISSNTPERGMGNYLQEVIPSESNEFKSDVKEILQLQPQFFISFTAYSQDDFEAEDVAKRAYDLLKFKLYYFLRSIDVTVIEIKNFGNRSVLEVDDYERRCGFDVRFRTSYKIERSVETVEKIITKE